MRNKWLLRLATFLILVEWVTPCELLAAAGQSNDRREVPLIELHKSLFGGLKYTYGDETRQRTVFGFAGLSFKKGFEEKLSRHPEALKKAKRCHIYNGMAMIGMVGLLTSSMKDLADSISDVNSVNSGQIPDTGFKASDLVLPVVSALMIVIPGMISRLHLQDGVILFNELELNHRLRPGEEPIKLERDFSVDVLLGMNRSALDIEGMERRDSRQGYTFGFLSQNRIGGPASFQTGFLLTSKGDNQRKLTYVEWPLQLRFDIRRDGISPFFYAGPSLNCLLNSEGIQSNDYYDESEEDAFVIDAGVNAAIGTRFGSKPLSIAMSYSNGLVNILTDVDENAPAETNSTISLLAFYGF